MIPNAGRRPKFSFVLPIFFLSIELLCHCEGIRSGSRSFGETCNLQNPCDLSQLIACVGGVCECESPSNQRYDNSTRKCLSVVGGPCTHSSAPSDVTTNCIKNAHCEEVTDEYGESYTQCVCKEGYIENSEGKCTPGLGKACSYQPGDCNPLGMVVCKNGICQCFDDLQVYDADMKRCVSPAGTHCKHDGLQLGCVKNAICYPFYYWIPPKCMCKPHYIQTKSRQCIHESRLDLSSKNNTNDRNGETQWPAQNNETVTDDD